MKILTIIILLLTLGCPSSSASENIDNECKAEALFIACTKEYIPVCRCDGNTYGNSCVAKANGIDSFTIGECDS
ncbi:MAG: hypothetical protein CL672_07055 [Balneola sp.]|nr:hypothetical protein [Balneola sp.]|tara:strand:+ start:2897 stop:3118 length:222 start_codon:yes stop_codon:yes gene_type:complete